MDSRDLIKVKRHGFKVTRSTNGINQRATVERGKQNLPLEVNKSFCHNGNPRPQSERLQRINYKSTFNGILANSSSGEKSFDQQESQIMDDAAENSNPNDDRQIRREEEEIISLPNLGDLKLSGLL